MSLKKLVYSGIDNSLPAVVKRKIILTNQIALTLAAISFFFMLSWLISQDLVGVYSNALIGLIYLLVPFLNSRRYYGWARFLTIVTMNFALFYFVGAIGRETDSHVSFFTLTIIPLLMYETKERFKLLLGVSVPVFSFLYLYAHDFRLFPYPFSTMVPGMALFTYLFNFLFIFISMLYFQRSTEIAQEQLEQQRSRSIYAAKMSALGEMAGGVAHEINNPLTVITLKCESLMRVIKKGQLETTKVEETIILIQRTAERISSIIKSLRSFSSPGLGQPMERCDLAQVIQNTMQLCSEKLKVYGVSLENTHPPKNSYIRCRHLEISQVIYNLLLNAMEALETTPHPWIKLEFQKLEHDRIQISVSNNGPLIPKELQEKIFQPFFTTKDVGKGTGLGLSISKGIVEEHQGQLYLDKSGPFTRFVIELQLIS